MTTPTQPNGFAARLHELCDDMGIPAKGRQSKLAQVDLVKGSRKLTPNGVRKWLKGIGFPEMDKAVALADWAGVNVNWLLQGVGPKRGNHVDSAALRVIEGISELPAEERQQVLDFIKYKFERSGGWFTAEKIARYSVSVDRMASSAAPIPANGTH